MEGHVELIEEKPKDLKRIKIDKVFYSYFGELTVKVGDVVKFEYSEKGKYKTIFAIEKIAQELTLKDRSIIKQTALKCACMAFHIQQPGNYDAQVAQIKKLAKDLETYLLTP